VIHEFRISIADADLADLESRLEAHGVRPLSRQTEALRLLQSTRWFATGCKGSIWRVQEAALNRFPQFVWDAAGTSPLRPCAQCAFVGPTAVAPKWLAWVAR